MGLLSKVSGKKEAGLDEIGAALRERIKRLPSQKTTPYTALSLLKAYGAFQSGACLRLKDDVYTSYTSVGMGIGKIAIPREKIWSAEKAGGKFFRFDFPEIPNIKNPDADISCWLFPLNGTAGDSSGPWQGVMILYAKDEAAGSREQDASVFDPRSIAEIIGGAEDKLLGAETRNTVQSVTESAGAGLKETITGFAEAGGAFSCVVMELPGGEDKDNFRAAASKMLDKAGNVIPLPDGGLLVLLSAKLDRDLIAHRLSRSLGAGVLASFSADSPESAVNTINSLSRDGRA